MKYVPPYRLFGVFSACRIVEMKKKNDRVLKAPITTHYHTQFYRTEMSAYFGFRARDVAALLCTL